MGEIDYTGLLPKAPPEGLRRWLMERGRFDEEYLIYKAGREYIPLEDRWEPAVEVVCTACGQRFFARKIPEGGCCRPWTPAPFGWWNPRGNEMVIHGTSTLCPCCGAEAQTRHIGQDRYGLEKHVWAAEVRRISVEGKQDRLAVIDWMVTRHIDKEGRESWGTRLYSAAIVEERKLVRVMGYRKTFSAISFFPEPEQRKTWLDEIGRSQNIYPWAPETLVGTTAANSKLDLYQAAGGDRLAAWLGLWRRRPQAENLLVQGFGRLVEELLEEEEKKTYGEDRGKGYPKLPEINWKEKKPGRMLGMTRPEMVVFRRKKWGKEAYRAIRWAREKGLELEFPRGVEQLARLTGSDREEILKRTGAGKEFWRALRYLEEKKSSWITLRDYWDMAQRLGMDLEDGLVRYPRNPKAAHDGAVERYNRQKDQLLEEGFHRRAEELAWLAWAQDGLLIRPCADQEELRQEGKELHHCVATYAQKHSDGKTAILFIRRTDAPDEPYYTLELDEQALTVRQNRGLRNCARTAEIRAFEDAWLAWAKGQRKKKKKRSAA